MIQLIARCAPGLENILAAEIRSLGGGIGKTKPGRGEVTFQGPDDALMRANLGLRSADRVMMPVVTDKAELFDSLTRLAGSQDWSRWLAHHVSIRFHVEAKGCKLFHKQGVEDALKRGMEAAGFRTFGPNEDGAEATLEARGRGDIWTLALDTSGARLGRRGYRLDPGRAPLRPDLAAGCLLACNYRGGPLLDAACGAGTFAIEAATIAAGVLPGARRNFAFERWGSLDWDRWSELQTQAGAAFESLPKSLPIEGADRSGPAVKSARDNLRRSGLLGKVSLHKRSIEDTPADRGDGLVVLNPPWGKRLKPAEVEAQYAAWGEVLRTRRPRWQIALLAPDPALATAFGARGRPRLKLRSGGVNVALYHLKPA